VADPVVFAAATAAAYVADVLAVRRGERALGAGTRLSAAVACGLHRLPAYKDDYEVARLLTDPAFEARLAAEIPGGVQRRYRLHPPVLHPPVLGTWAGAEDRVVRRLERELRDEYRAMVLRLASSLTAQSYDTAVAAAQAADLVRVYEGVKLANVQRYRARLAELGVSWPANPRRSRWVRRNVGGATVGVGAGQAEAGSASGRTPVPTG